MSGPDPPAESHTTKKGIYKKKRKRPTNPLTHSRPHFADFAFPSSYPSRSPKTTSPNMILFALGMSWSRERDRIRLQMILNQKPGRRIITVSDCLHSAGRMRHVECEFNTVRGQKPIATRIETEREETPTARIIVFLDYYWLQAHYYTLRYGLKWLEDGAHLLLNAGADEVVLPYDGGSGNLPSGSDMTTMLAGTYHPNINVKFSSLQDNILWLASNEEEIRTWLSENDGGHGGDNGFQTEKCLHPKTPFVTVTLKNDK
jgi:hypothetical protein